jgi:hypothetical protein
MKRILTLVPETTRDQKIDALLTELYNLGYSSEDLRRKDEIHKGLSKLGYL